jgi:hypothetical protein
LWANYLPSGTNRGLQLDLDHMASLKAASFRHAVYQRFIEINDQRLLMRPHSGCA